MTTKNEIIKSAFLAIIPLSIGIYGSLIFLATCESKIFSISTIVFLTIIYLILLKNDLEKLKNDYDHDISENEKKWKKEIENTQLELEKSGKTFTGEAMQKLGKLSAYKEVEKDQLITSPLEVPSGSMPKGEVHQNYEDYKNHRTKKFKLEFTRAKYIVLIKLFLKN